MSRMYPPSSSAPSSTGLQHGPTRNAVIECPRPAERLAAPLTRRRPLSWRLSDHRKWLKNGFEAR
jgi:hypothetical protein